jgi:hypothetical protein
MMARATSRSASFITLLGVLSVLGMHASSASATPTLRVAIGSLSTTSAGDAALEGPLRVALEQALDALPTVDRTQPARAQLVVEGSLVRLERTAQGVRAEVSLLVSERRGGAVRMLLSGRAEARGGSDPVPASITAAVRSAMRPLADPAQTRLATR